MTDSAVAEPDDLTSSRRSLLGTGALGAGVLGAALALGLPRQVGAAAPGTVSENDRTLITFAIGLELAARDLYQAAIDAGNTAPPWRILSDQHRAYAERLAGLIGVPANVVDAAVFSQLEASFTGDRPANAAFGLENTAAATHIQMLGALDDPVIAEIVAAIAAMESRHAAYLAERSGRGGDFDALFSNSAAPLAPEASS